VNLIIYNMGLYLKQAEKPSELLQGEYFQQELMEVLTKIWNNQTFLDNKDLNELKKYT